MAITIMVMARMKKFNIFGRSYFVSHGFTVNLTMAKRMERAITIRIAEVRANFPISLANCSNFCQRGVLVYSSCPSKALILPMHDSAPTTTITIFPSPVNTLVPPIITGDTSTFLSIYPWAIEDFFLQIPRVYFTTGLVSPVIELSSMVTSFDLINTPSAGIYIPSLTATMSPTNTKSW